MLFYGENHKDIKRINAGNPHIQTIGDLYNALYESWSKETAYRSCQAEWNEGDRSYGQCAVTAMIVFDMFGGTIHRIRNNDGSTHYFNKIDGHYFDLTREQFDLYNIPVKYEPNETMDRKYCGRSGDTLSRYKKLMNNLNNYLDSLESSGNAIHEEIVVYEAPAKVEATASGETPKCPNCGKPMIKRSGKFGEFYGCSDFPKCRGTVNIK